MTAGPGRPAAAVELPLRIIDQEGGFVIRCFCGRESAVLRRGVANPDMPGLRSSGMAMTQISSDLTPVAVLKMAIHARSCLRGQNAAADQARMAAS